MRRASILISVTLAWLATAATADVAWFDGTFEAAKAEAARAKTMVMIDFYTDWCGWCDTLDEETYSDDKVAKALADVVCIKINPEKKEGEAEGKLYGVSSFPTILFVDPEGLRIDAIRGYVPPDGFLSELARIRRGEGTEKAIRQALERNPDNVEAHFQMATRLLGWGETEEAREHLARVVATDPANGKGHTDDAAFQMVAIDVGEALTALSMIMQAAQSGPDLDGSAGELAVSKGTDKGMRKVVAATLAKVKIVMKKGGARTKLGEAEKMIGDGQKAVLGIAAGKMEKALTRYKETDMLEAVLVWLHNVYGELGENEKLAIVAERLTEVRGDDAEMLNNIAWDMLGRGDRLEKARELAQRAVALEPEAAHMIDTLAEIEFALGERERAIELMTKAIALSPDEPLYKSRLEKYQGEK